MSASTTTRPPPMTNGSLRSIRATKPPRIVAIGVSPQPIVLMMPIARPSMSDGTMAWRSAPQGTFQTATPNAPTA